MMYSYLASVHPVHLLAMIIVYCTIHSQAWPDSAIKREIANLKVKCENYKVGCDWEGLFKQLMVCPTIL